MIQRYDERDNEELKALNVYEALIAPFELSVETFYDNYMNSPELARAVYNAHASPLFDIFNDKYRFENLMNSYSDALIYLRSADSIINLVEVATAGSCIITLPKPAVVYIDAEEGNVNVFWNKDSEVNVFQDGTTPLGEPVIFTRDNSETGEPGIVFEVPFHQYSLEGFEKVLRDLMSPGFYLKYSLMYINT